MQSEFWTEKLSFYELLYETMISLARLSLEKLAMKVRHLGKCHEI